MYKCIHDILLRWLIAAIITVLLGAPRIIAASAADSSEFLLAGIEIGGVLHEAPSKTGFDQSAVEAITGRFLDSLYDEGYYLARLTRDSAVMSAQNITLYMSVSTGPLVIVERLALDGIIRSDRKVIYSRLPEVAGQPLTPHLIRSLESAADRIRHVRFVPPAEVRLQPGYTEAEVVARFREQQPVTFYGGGGYTPDDPAGLLWTVRFTLNNLFGGGRRVEVNSARPDRNRTVLDVAYAQPVSVFNRDDLTISLHTRDYRDDFYEFAVRTGLTSQFSEEFAAEAALGWKRVEPSGDDPGYSSYTVELGIRRDDTNEQFNPTSGNSLKTTVAFRHRRYSSDSLATTPEKTAFNDTRTHFEANRYQPVTGAFLIRGSLAYSGVETSETLIPLSELHLVGGSDGLRGYRTEQFAVQRVATAVLEPRWRFANGFGFLFYEGAYLNLPAGKDNRELYRDGYGLGLGLVTDARAVILSLAWGRDAAFDRPRLAVQLSADL